MREIGLYRLVFEYYEARILYGYYRYGEKLPSIAKMCQVFDMAPATIRAALAELEKQGYVKIDARKAAQVIYQVEGPSVFRREAALYFVPRKKGIEDLALSGQLLFEPLWEAGLQNWEGPQWETLRKGMVASKPDDISMPVQFYILALASLHNRLCLNLYWEMVRYIRFPYLGDAQKKRPVFHDLEDSPPHQLIALLKGRFSSAYQQALIDLFAFCDASKEEYGLSGLEEVPFRWNIYHQRPQLRYTLASRLIREIIVGAFPTRALPSLPELAKRYGVSLNTVRRALEILSSLGMTRTLHGKGTFVCECCLAVDCGKPELQEGVRLYCECLQLLALTVKGACLHTLEHISMKERAALLQKLDALNQVGKSYLCFETILSFIESFSGLAAVGECYRKVRELLTWGYPLVLQRAEGKSIHSLYVERTEQAVRHLRAGALLAFAEDWEALMQDEYRQVQTFMKGQAKEF